MSIPNILFFLMMVTLITFAAGKMELRLCEKDLKLGVIIPLVCVALLVIFGAFYGSKVYALANAPRFIVETVDETVHTFDTKEEMDTFVASLPEGEIESTTAISASEYNWAGIIQIFVLITAIYLLPGIASTVVYIRKRRLANE